MTPIQERLAKAIHVEHWEAHDEYIITVSGHGPIGHTMRQVDANQIREWLIYNYASLARVLGIPNREDS